MVGALLDHFEYCQGSCRRRQPWVGIEPQEEAHACEVINVPSRVACAFERHAVDLEILKMVFWLDTDHQRSLSVLIDMIFLLAKVLQAIWIGSFLEQSLYHLEKAKAAGILQWRDPSHQLLGLGILRTRRISCSREKPFVHVNMFKIAQ